MTAEELTEVALTLVDWTGVYHHKSNQMSWRIRGTDERIMLARLITGTATDQFSLRFTFEPYRDPRGGTIRTSTITWDQHIMTGERSRLTGVTKDKTKLKKMKDMLMIAKLKKDPAA